MYHPKVTSEARTQLEQSLKLTLREYTRAEVEEFAYRLREVDWAAGLGVVLPGQPQDVQAYIMNELLLSKVDWRYWSERYCRIVDDAGRVVPVVLRPSQEKVLEKIAAAELRAWEEWKERKELAELSAKIRLILVKARQVGGTVVGEDLVAHLTLLHKNTRSIIASDDIRTNSVKLYRVFSLMFDNLPGWMRPTAESRVKATNMHFQELNSDLVVGGGNQKNTLGQGMTIDAVHLTEMSTWAPDVAEAVDEDLKPAFESSRKHHTLFMIESTGQGGKGNWFHDQYQAAATGKSRYIPMFLGWHSCPDKWALYDPGVVIAPETESLAKRLEGEQPGLKLTRDQLVWYQTTKADYESRGQLQKFLQEFPSSAEEAFQMGVKSVFSIEVRTRVRNECKVPVGVFDVDFQKGKLKEVELGGFLSDPSEEKALNRILMWEKPRAGFTYVVGVDASYGVDGGDNSCVSVVRVGNRWEKDEQVAEWSGNIPPAWLDVVAWILGHIYKDKIEGLPALMAIETNPGSPGIVCQTRLLERNYPNFYVMKRPNKVGGGWTRDIGWHTTEATRTPLLETGVDAVNRGLLKVNSPFFVSEMGTFVVKMTPTGRRKLEHADGYHDDRIFALFIAYYVAHEGDVSSLAEDRARYWQQKQDPTPRQVRQFQQIMGTQEDLMRSWEERAEDLLDALNS